MIPFACVWRPHRAALGSLRLRQLRKRWIRVVMGNYD